ncbi:MAG: TIGR00730 family Rossman fold protein [Bacteroidales bacterium]|jgi:uncharacterized protein (TIGR00730 family)|nr:TIGR00730 family Rossman fold protein [Bacteroidales bacterium]
MEIQKIALFCGSSSGNGNKYTQLAHQFGLECGKRKISLIYGGARIGLMNAAAVAAQSEGGEVIGIAPRFFDGVEVLASDLNEMILVDSMSDRKQLMEQMADAFVILPGSFGTMDEFFEILTDAQLGLHNKPICLLNAYDYYTPLIAQLEIFKTEGFLRSFHFDLMVQASEVEEVFMKLANYQYCNNRNWLEKIKN